MRSHRKQGTTWRHDSSLFHSELTHMSCPRFVRSVRRGGCNQTKPRWASCRAHARSPLHSQTNFTECTTRGICTPHRFHHTQGACNRNASRRPNEQRSAPRALFARVASRTAISHHQPEDGHQAMFTRPLAPLIGQRGAGIFTADATAGFKQHFADLHTRFIATRTERFRAGRLAFPDARRKVDSKAGENCVSLRSTAEPSAFATRSHSHSHKR